ncbi:ABC transporter substrate-binding protein [Burkholderia cenocepacia]|uniref:ABC transporter substrate-binding protein n=1 Tax=Burkholderia cenocepacia TaxID=95486 RepID=UPI00406CDE31
MFKKLLCCAVASTLSIPAFARFSDNKIVIGVLGDQSGVVADVGGPGSILAAKMAVEDFGGKVNGVPVEVLSADHQEKAEIASTIAREWFDRKGVDVIVDLPNTGVVYALASIAREKKRLLMVSGAAAVDITGSQCSSYVSHWTDDTYSLSQGTAKVLMKQGYKNWFFLTDDYSFGHALEKDASTVVTSEGGKVLGSAKSPLGTTDYSTLLLRARASRAQVIALASAGTDTINAIKQAAQYGIKPDTQRIAALHAFITDVNSIGLQAAQGLIITSGFYWNESNGTRAFAKRFFAKQGRMPTREQAGVYVSVMHYLKAAKVADTDNADTVTAEMRKIPVDKFGQVAHLEANGRVTYDLGVYQVRKPGDVKTPWDYYERIGTVPAAAAFRPAAQSGCQLPSK